MNSGAPASAESYEDLLTRLNDVSSVDAARLQKRLNSSRNIKKQSRQQTVQAEIAESIAQAESRLVRRVAARPAVSYPSELPITARRDEIIEAISENQVVVIAGETGSGKSTQLPKMCLAAGYGRRGLIGHTQPRRIAARSVAARIAEELDVPLGKAVGYSVRFDNRTDDSTSIRVMTDGILLAELNHDRDLLAYDAIIIDEAHERSLNIDFLLGYLRQLVDRRPDLRVIITSATIDTTKIATHFDDAPIIEVSGRTFPVEIRYRPRTADGENLDAAGAVRQAVGELAREGPGDILVFSSGEREINDICESIRRHESDIEVLPLYARLSTKEQQRVFGKSKRRRVVVATNVAETSLTVPGVRYVVDLGEARMSRFSQRTKVQRLPIEPVSQASANQRSGRCGRLGPGVAIRLYDQDDFDARPEFTEPEIQRTNLAAVILTMAGQNLGSPLDFPFLDPPEPRAVTDGARLLFELGAVKDNEIGGDRQWLTDTGRALSRMPIDPRLGRMILGGDEQGCLHESVIIAAGLAVQDPRERPREKQQAADVAHRPFTDDRSDVLSLLHLWHAATNVRRDRSRRQFTTWCRDRFLHAQRMLEWFDTIEQLRSSCDELELSISYSSDFDVMAGPHGGADDPTWGDDIHRAVLPGLLSQIGMRIERSHDYLGPRSARFAIQPGSTCFETKPSWILAATLVETTRLWARTVAPINPEWVEAPAEHLTSVEIGDAEWFSETGRALTTETVRLYGLPIVADRVIPLDRYDPTMAREMFIHHALIEGDWPGTFHAFTSTNASVRHEVRNLAARSSARTQRSFDDEYDRVWAFYDAALPAHVTGAVHFESWFGPASAEDPHLLEMGVHDLITVEEAEVDEAQFPEEIAHGDLRLALDYQRADSAIAVELPVAGIASIEPTTFLGVVPGHRRDAIIALVRALPKTLRKRLVPVPETVDAILAELAEHSTEADASGRFALALRHSIERRLGQTLPIDALDPRSLPVELRPHYRVVDEHGAPLAEGTDLASLRAQLAADIDSALADGSEGISHPGAKAWDFGDLPAQVTIASKQGTTTAYPALVDRTDQVGVDLLGTPGAQSTAMWAGARRLLRLTIAAPLRQMNSYLDTNRQFALTLTPHGDRASWFEDLTLACLGTIIDNAGAPRSAEAFEELQAVARRELPRLIGDAAPVAAEILDETAAIRMAIAAADQLPADCVDDCRLHLERLTYPGHLAGTGLRRLPDVLRYLKGITHRLDKLPTRVRADRESMHQILAVEDAYDTVAEHLPWSPSIEAVAWSLEELRVSMFAQHLGTNERVSPKRIRRTLEQITAA